MDCYQKKIGEALTAGVVVYTDGEVVTSSQNGDAVGTVAVDAAAEDATVLINPK